MSKKTFIIPTKFVFEGDFIIKADTLEEAVGYVENSCGLVLGQDIHTTLDNNNVDFSFNIHPEKIITDNPDEIQVIGEEDDEEKLFGTAYFQFKLPDDVEPINSVAELDYTLTHPLIQYTEVEEFDFPYILIKAYFDCDQDAESIDAISNEVKCYMNNIEEYAEMIIAYTSHQEIVKRLVDLLPSN